MTRAEELAQKHETLMRRLGLKSYMRELASREIDRLVVEIAHTQREIQDLAREQTNGRPEDREAGSVGTAQDHEAPGADLLPEKRPDQRAD